jgi:hypothetical protein
MWDLIAAYAPGTTWREVPPEPIVFNGPVVQVADELDFHD